MNRGGLLAPVLVALVLLAQASGCALPGPRPARTAGTPTSAQPTSATAGTGRATEASSPGGEFARLQPVVDVHCHVFNAHDVAVQDFLTAHGAPRDLAAFVQVAVDALDEERAPERLAALSPGLRQLGEQIRELLGARPAAASPGQLMLLETLFRLSEAGPLRAELDRLSSGPRPEGTLGGWAGQARDALRWALLLSRKRESLAAQLVRTYPDTALFTPLIVDMHHWFGERAALPGSYQAQLDAMRALLREYRGRMLPFAAFDPERERLRRLEPGAPPLRELLRGLAEEGFVGIKLYPPFGFRPARNDLLDPAHECAVRVPHAQRLEYDGLLEELYSACEALDLAISAHCEDPGAGLAQCGEHADPRWWAVVLERHPNLRLDLMHMGGVEGLVANPRQSWGRTAAELMHRYPHVYADTGAHAVPGDPDLRERFFAVLTELERELPGLRRKVMFGTDWHLTVRHPEHELFERRYLTAWEARWGLDAARRFAGQAALEFLGLQGGRTGERVRALFQRQGWPIPDWLRAR